MPQTNLFSNADTHGGWPQWNERREQALREDLLKIQDLAPHNARNRLKDLETRHKERRNLVWAELGECVLFVDGLRFDVARRLSDRLSSKGLTVEEAPTWAAIPSVTATGKPAVTPVYPLIVGQEANADFVPCVASTGQSLKGGYYLQKLLADEGWHLLDKSKDQELQGPAWCEVGNIDHEGHDQGWKLAMHLETMPAVS